jgi:molybdopterin converting factor small subunit
LFAAARQLAGRESVELELPNHATVAQLREAIGVRLPQVSDFTRKVTFAIGTQYADDSSEVPDGAEIACIPPVSGG